MRRINHRAVLAAGVTGLLVLVVWVAPQWSEVPVDEQLTVRVEPQLIAPGTATAPAQDAGYGVKVDVAGVGAGHEVRLQTWADGRWSEADTGETDSRGHLRLESAEGTHGRVVTELDGEQVTANAHPIGQGPPLLGTEDFDGDALDQQWLLIPQPDDGGTCTEVDERAVSMTAGQLAVGVEEDPRQFCERTGQPARLNGHVILRAAVGYGTTAARVKFPTSRAVTGQLWLQPGDPGARWVMDGEHEGVVIAETAGTGTDPRISTSVNRVVDGEVKSSRRRIPLMHAPSDGRFHVYSVEWTPRGFTFRIDGEVTRQVNAEGPVPPMSIAMAALAPGPPPLPAEQAQRTMYVDWLRVWAP